jgi:hypothetical protein
MLISMFRSFRSCVNAVDVNWLTIGVEDLRAAVSADGFFDGLDTKAHLRSPLSLINARDKLADGQPPGKHPATEPVDDGDEVYKAFGHGHVRDVDRPDLVRPGHRQSAQEVGINLVTWLRLRRVGLTVERLDAHPLHQCRDVKPPHVHALPSQQVPQHPAAGKRIVEVRIGRLG